MKNKTLSNRLRDFSLLSSAFLMMKSEAASQIIYQTYDSDNLNVDTYFDLNNDGEYDLQFLIDGHVNSNGGYGYSWEVFSWEATAGVQAINNGALAVSYSGYNLTKVNPGQIINSSMTWCECEELLAHRFIDYVTGADSYSGYWFGQAPTYFGFRITEGNDKYYGWMRISTGGDASVKVYDYAYNSTPNQPIVAGATGCEWLNATTQAMPGDTVCIGDTVTLQASPAAGFNFTWQKVGFPGVMFPHDSVLQIPSGNADYRVIVSVLGSCYDTSEVVHVLHANSATIYFQDDTLFADPPNVVQWYLDGNVIPGAIDNFYIPNISGNYSVTTQFGECFSESPGYFFTSIPLLSNSIYPKIICDDIYLHVVMNPQEFQRRLYSIYDVLGRKLLQWHTDQSILKIPISEIPTGEYFLVIREENKQFSFGFLKN